MNGVQDTIRTLLEEILRRKPTVATKLIAIDGRGGSGKSTLARALIDGIPGGQLVQVDAFPYRQEEQAFHFLGTQTAVNWKRLELEVLIPLREGLNARYARTPWWISEVNKPEPIELVSAGGVVIVEGCYCLRRELRNYFDFKMWVECDTNEGLTRALSRDGGAKDRRVWEEVYIPNETHYIQEHSPHLIADMKISSAAREWMIVS